MRKKHTKHKGRQMLQVKGQWRNQAEEQWPVHWLWQTRSFIKRRTNHLHAPMYTECPIAMVGMNVELATPSSDPSPRQHVRFLFYFIYKCFSNFSGHNHWKCFEKKLWNMGFGTKTPISNIFFKKTLIIHQFYVHAIVANITFFYVYFFKNL